MSDLNPDTAIEHHLTPSDAPITDVTVFGDRSQVTREVPLPRDPGPLHRVILHDITPRAQVDSFHVVRCAREFTILEVGYQSTWETPEEKTARMNNDKGNDGKCSDKNGDDKCDGTNENGPAAEAAAIETQLKTVRKSLRKVRKRKERRGAKSSWISGYGSALIGRGVDSSEPGIHALKKMIASKGSSSSSSSSSASASDVTTVLPDVNQASKFLEFMDSEMEEIDNKDDEDDEEIESLTDEAKNLERRLTAIRGRIGHKEESREVAILLARSTEGNGDDAQDDQGPTLSLAYLSDGASWKASYDARIIRGSTDGDSSMSLIFFAVITNSTEEDWKNASVSLSTALPSVGGRPPRLETAKVRFERPKINSYRTQGIMMKKSRMFESQMMAQAMPQQIQQRSSRRRSLSSFDELDDELSASESDDEVMAAEFASDAAGAGAEGEDAGGAELGGANYSSSTSKGGTSGSTTFELPHAVTIPSDSVPRKKHIKEMPLVPFFSTAASPKVSPHCFVKVSTRNCSDLPLLPGPISVFIGGKYVTKSEIEAVGVGQAFALYAGVDEMIKISYPAPKTNITSAGGMLSRKSNQVITTTQKITFKNSRAGEANVVLYEQLPLSEDDESIKVKLVSPSPQDVKINDANNVEIRFAIPANEEKEIIFAHAIEYPKEKGKIEIV